VKSAKRVDHTGKRRPKVAGGVHGQNTPLELLQYLSEWVSILELRGTVTGELVYVTIETKTAGFVSSSCIFRIGPALGSILGALAGFDDSLAGA
jgi:hypothetical protein